MRLAWDPIVLYVRLVHLDSKCIDRLFLSLAEKDDQEGDGQCVGGTLQDDFACYRIRLGKEKHAEKQSFF
jgi:hypothetical protein